MTNPGTDGFVQLINNLPNESIGAITIDGHGSRTDIGLDGGYNSSSSIHNLDGRIGLLNTKSDTPWVALEPLLLPKLAKDSEIMVRSCNTARWDNNISNAMSKTFPDVKVTVYMGFGMSNDEIYGSSYGGSFRWGVTQTYLNGKSVDSWNVECECEW